MGSTLAVLRTLTEGFIRSGVSTTSTDPSSTLLNTYINKAISKIAREVRPRELRNSTVASVDIVSGQNTATYPTTLIVPEGVYYQGSGGSYRELQPVSLTRLIDIEGQTNFFNSSNTGDPGFYAIRSTEIVVNKYFNRSATGAIKVYGINVPTSLTLDATACDLVTDYDLLIAYYAAQFFYQGDEDDNNMQKYFQLANAEKAELKTFMEPNYDNRMVLDPNIYAGSTGYNQNEVLYSL